MASVRRGRADLWARPSKAGKGRDGFPTGFPLTIRVVVAEHPRIRTKPFSYGGTHRMTTRALPLLAAISCMGLAACGGIDVTANIPDFSGGGTTGDGTTGDGTTGGGTTGEGTTGGGTTGGGTTGEGTTGGGTTGGGTTGLPIVQLSDGRILAGSSAIAAGDYTGRTFPIQVAVTLDEAPEAIVGAGFGTVEVVGAHRLIGGEMHLGEAGRPPHPGAFGQTAASPPRAAARPGRGSWPSTCGIRAAGVPPARANRGRHAAR
jgi:hypothetical protein